MTRRISTLLLTTILAVSLFSVPLFAAKASKNTGKTVNQAATATTIYKQIGGEDEPISQGTVSGKQSKTVRQSLGYQAVNGIVDLGVTTQYDLPSNQSVMRQIAVGCSGNIKVVFTYREDEAAQSPRSIAAGHYFPGAAITPPNLVASSPSAGAGFPDLAIAGDSTSLCAWHSVSGGGTFVGQEATCNNDILTPSLLYPDSNNVITGTTENGSNYIWPRIAVDYEADGDWFAHVISHESPPTSDATGYQSLIYRRSQANSRQPVGTGTTLATFIDTVSGITGTVIAAPLQADQRVAIVYTKPRNFPATSGINDDIYYRESTDLGVTWGAKTKIYAFADTTDPAFSLGVERGWETTGLYAADGCLHVLFQSSWPSDTLGNSIYYTPARVRHWDKCSNLATVVTEAFSAVASCNQQARNIGKVSLSECQGKLYAIFSKSLSETNDDNVEVYRDCSVGGMASYDLIVKASSTWGATWGPDSNITKTRAAGPTYNCASGTCQSEMNLGSVEHTTDSLRILFIEDKDAGVFVGTAPDGDPTDNPIKVASLGCFNMATFQELTTAPGSIKYPFRTAPSGIKDTSLTINNFGNIPTPYTSAISYISGSGWLAFGGTQGPVPSGSVPVGATSSELIGLRATGPVAQGLYQANVTFTYDSPPVVLTVGVDLYNFTTFHLPQNAALRTNINQMNVNQTSQVSDNVAGRMFNYFADAPDTSYLYEGHLVIGNDVLNLSYSVAGGVGAPSLTNPYGYLYAASATMDIDSVSFASYRKATGKGVNRDTTVGFDVNWYTSKHPDSGDFYVGQFKVYKGSKNPAGSISNLSIAYYTDWDVPSDTGSDNTAGSIPAEAAIWQRGAYTIGHENRYAATAAYRNDGTDIVGGWVLTNPTYIYPNNGYDNDSLWNIMEILPQGTYRIMDSTTDMSGGVLVYRDLTINGAANDTVKFVVVLAGTRQGGLAGVQLAIDKAQKFLCGLGLAPGADICSACLCGDANNTGSINISDAVFIINYIFAGGAAPAQPCLGDANGTGSINISDAVYIINFIFGGGPTPFCAP